jgi:hypothetical protein
MKSCITCGMPLEGAHEGDVGMETAEGPVCSFDIDGGAVRDGSAIFEGGVAFFQGEVTDGDRELAERLTRKNMAALPYWIARPFAELEGEKASEEEWAECMARM